MSDDEQPARPASEQARALGVGEECRVLLLDPPLGFARKLEPLPRGATVATRPFGQADRIALFASSQAVLAELLQRAVGSLAPRGHLFCAWPRRASGIFTDLNEELVRAAGLSHALSDDKLLLLDESWSALRFAFKERPRLSRPGSQPGVSASRPGA